MKKLLRKEWIMMNNNYAYAETLDVLSNMSQTYINKIPEKILKFLKENADKNYKKRINPYEKLNKQNLDKKTLGILAMINYKYWKK